MIRILFTLIALTFATPVFAQASNASQPVEISAAKSLEWNRKAKTYTAQEKVKVTQGTMTLNSDTLTAKYNDDKGMTDITTITAKDNVVIHAQPYTAYGDLAVYDVKTGNATLTGNDLHVTNDADMLTAQEKIVYRSVEQRLDAVGKAVIVHADNELRADVLSAYFAKDASGKMAATQVTAEGNVSVKTPKETITGQHGVYDVPAQKAVLTGKVMIRQGENWLEGTRANIDMATGISQLLGAGNTETEGRVKGVFYPSSAKKKKTESQ